MNQEEIRGLLNQPYNSENWKKIAKDIFPDAHIYAEPKQLLLPDNKQIDIIYTIGEVRLHSGEILLLYEVKVKHNVNIYRSRVALREALAKTIDYEKSNGVLVVYEQGRDDYRFTFAAKEVTIDPQTGNSIVRETDKKRFTYILGKNEKCRTAASRFFDIKSRQTRGEEINLQSVIDAFNVGKLNDEFFADYRKIYGNYTKAVTGFDEDQKGDGQLMQNFEQYFGGNDDLARKNARDFVKKMMGRIVFLYFVQKKGWLGVSAAKGWGEGDLSFMKHLFDATYDKNSFYKNVLEPLFYQNLNAARHNDIFDINTTLFSDGFADNIRIPYLNGGLFSDDMPATNGFQFPGEEALFKAMFEFLEKYNFTIDENSDREQTVAIDPEMLGHVFENLLEDNKEKGAFYTPREVVHYMCRQSLAEYLTTTLETKHGIKDYLLRKKMENFVVNDDASEVRDWVQPLALALREVKVCDPAIGSGAFPMGMLREILEALYTLASVEEQTVREVWEIPGLFSDNIASIKEQIIQNSIYGVDIEKGAVDIARLRFWLSLIVEEEEPKALPNLDYKIVVGNSLISKLGAINIEIKWDVKIKSAFQTNIFGSAELYAKKGKLLRRIGEVQKEFFNPESNKKKLAAYIRKLKIDLLINQLELMVSTEGTENKTNKLGNKIGEKATRHFQSLSWKESIDQLKKLKDQPEIPLSFFDWKLDFPEVLNELISPNPGFDIVIGNPPYVNVEKIDISIKNNISKFRTAYQKYDLYVLFYEVALNLLKRKGILSFITSNKFLSQGYGFKLRKEFLIYRIDQIVNFNFDIFESATVRTCIIQVSKTHPDLTHNIEVIDVNSIRDKDNFINRVFVEVPQKTFEETEENNFRINLTKEKISILNKIEHKSLLLYDICSVNYGLRPSSEKLGLKKEAFIYEKQSNAKFKPYFEGKDMGYWLVNNISYLDYQPDSMYNAMFPELFENDKLVGLRTLSDISKLRFIYDNKGYYCNDSVVVLTLWNKLQNVKYSTIKRMISKDKVEISKNYTYNFLQAILNSRMIKFYVNELMYDGTHFYPNHMKALPIKITELTKQDKLVKLVDKIHSIKSTNKQQDTITIENEIDNLVYRLYGLSYDDVKVIDPDYSLSQSEYESIDF